MKALLLDLFATADKVTLIYVDEGSDRQFREVTGFQTDISFGKFFTFIVEGRAQPLSVLNTEVEVDENGICRRIQLAGIEYDWPRESFGFLFEIVRPMQQSDLDKMSGGPLAKEAS